MSRSRAKVSRAGSATTSRSRRTRSYYSEDTATRASPLRTCPTILTADARTLSARCVFYGDLYPNKECYSENIARNITLLIEARQRFAYGATDDYLAHPNYIGFVRRGDATHPGCAVILSNKEDE